MLTSGSGDQFCDHYLPCFGGGLLLCLFTKSSALGVYFFVLPPFSGADCISPAPSAVCVLLQFIVCFSLGKFGLGCCYLAQEISSVIHYLPCFGEWLIALLLSVFTAFPVFIYQ
jgi:hypothetical protein